MSRIGAKKRISSTSEGSSKGRRKNGTSSSHGNQKATYSSSKSTQQRQVNQAKRSKQSKGKDESIRLKIDSKWQEGANDGSHQRTEKINRAPNKAMVRSNLDTTIANFGSLMSQ